MSDLTSKQRKRLPDTEFAIPEKAPGSGSYPIPDLAHARDALARSSGKPEEGRVRTAVHKKFPALADKESPAEDKGENEQAEKPKSEREAAARFIARRNR